MASIVLSSGSRASDAAPAHHAAGGRSMRRRHCLRSVTGSLRYLRREILTVIKDGCRRPCP